MAPEQAARSDTRFAVSADAARMTLSLFGEVGLPDLPALQEAVSEQTSEMALTIDLSDASRIDTSIAWFIVELRQKAESAGRRAQVIVTDTQIESFLASIERSLPVAEIEPPRPRGLSVRVANIGRSVATIGEAVSGFTALTGLFVMRLVQSIRHPREFRLTALTHHCEAVGLQAVPIVALMSFLIGIVLAFQGSAQLRQFGAEVFVVDLIAISILRELGILLTAIIVAGRTASAFTAAIGSMKMREEIDAMRTLGIDPGQALVVPRVLALVLMLPILGLIANASGLFGGMVMAWIELGISPSMFATRLVEGTDVSHVVVGLSKAPVFAVLIGIIGCQAGLSVGNNAESLGRKTSTAVVAAIFAVILADAIFSIFYQVLGL
ncbi:MAG: ABC transporter permease [Pseudomonadota bacterium]